LSTAAKSESKAKDKYVINIEGVEHEWAEPTITVAQIRTLAGWESTQEVIIVDLKENTERTLAEGETIELKPGMGFGKKVGFKRG
jgi:hypothetical protein